ncbi:MAG: ABC transporter permease [Bryobacteraceae bacterium]
MNWWQRLLKKTELEQKLDSELRFHFDQQVAENIRRGMSADEARRAARLKFGGLEQLKEDCREARGTRWIENAVQDLRFSLRMLRRSPGFTIIAVASLALGIGANTAIFSVMDALMLRLLPVQHPEQLVLFGEGHASGINDDFPHYSPDLFSHPFYREIRNDNQVFSDIAAEESMSGDVHARFGKTGGELEPVTIRLVSGNYFSMLGVKAYTGRVLTPEDDRIRGGAPVAVMRYGYWTRRFAQDPAVIGRALSFNNTVFTIVGIAAPEFFGTEVGTPPDIWIPLAMQAQVQPWFHHPFDTLEQSLWLIGRMRPGVTMAQAQTEANARFAQWLHALAGSSPSPDRIEDMRKARVKLTEAARGISRLRRRFSRPLQILMVVVGLVLVIACVNIANLLLARAAARRREIAVRIALGAQRRRLIGQLLSESLFLALIGGCLGLLVSIAGGRVLLAMFSPGPNTVSLDTGPNGPVLLFTLGLSLATGLIFGSVPAMQMTRVDAGPSLKEGKGLARTQSNSRLGQILVAAQVALAFFLVIGAGLFVTTLAKLEQTNTGFDKDRVLLLRLDSDSLNAKGPALVALYRRLEARIQALPGVEAASFSFINFDEGHWMTPVWRQGGPFTEANAMSFSGNRVGAQYFDVLGIPLVAGRGFRPQDTPQSPPIAVVNETFARRLFPNVSPLGRQFAFSEHDHWEIVGVVKDAKYESVREAPVGMFYFYNGQDSGMDGYNELVVRAQGRPEALIGEIRGAVSAENPNLAISHVTTLAESVDHSLGEEKLLAKLAGFFGLLALLLASIGLYGMIAYSVARRTNEIGIRMALGARPANILRAVLRESLGVVLFGLAIGLPAALACGGLVSSQLYDVKASDPATIAGAAIVLLLTALAASFLPARRAALIDPLVALREE